MGQIRGYVALAHPTTVIGKSSRLAYTLKIDWLRDRSTSCAPAAPTEKVKSHQPKKYALKICIYLTLFRAQKL